MRLSDAFLPGVNKREQQVISRNNNSFVYVVMKFVKKKLFHDLVG